MDASGPAHPPWRRLAILALILLPIALHFGEATARLLVRDVELAIDTNPEHPEPTGYVAQPGAAPIAFVQNERGLREGLVPETPERPATRVEFRWDPVGRNVTEVALDGAPIDPGRVVVVRDETPLPASFDFVVVRIPRADGRRPFAIAGLVALFWLGMLALLHPVIERRRALGLAALSLFTYSHAWTRHVKRRDVAIGFAVCAATMFSMVGVDAAPIYDVFRISHAGLDAYQYQVCYHAVWNNEFPTFMYHPLLLEFWTFFDRAWGLAFAHAPLVGGQPLFQVFLVKLVNTALLQLMVLSVISFAEEEKLLAERPRLTFYLALFNPVLWYVALLFVQFDTVPLYFVTLGVLLSHRFERHGLVGPLFLALGCSMKAQNVLLLPTAGVAFAYNAMSAGGPLRARLRTVVLGLVTMAVTMFVFRVLPSRTGAPLQQIFASANQLVRAFNGFPYASVVIVYFVFATLTFVFLAYAFALRLGIESRAMIAGSILTSGAVIMVFNASHLFTPSTLLQIGAAITMALAVERDPLRRVILSIATVLIVLSTATAPYGDIGRMIPGTEGFFTKLDRDFTPAWRTQFMSLTFTLSVSAMFAYAVFFWRGAKRLLARPLES